MVQIKLLIGAVLLLGGCSQAVRAPADPGVCWRMTPNSEPPAFTVLDRGIANLETCAVRLEAVRMMGGGGSVTGAYGGRFIFVSEAELTSAATRDGPRFRVLEPQHRAEIQRGVRKLMEARAAAAAAAAPPAAP